MKKHKKSILGLSLMAILGLSLVLATIILDVDTVAEIEEALPDRTPIKTYEVRKEAHMVYERKQQWFKTWCLGHPFVVWLPS